MDQAAETPLGDQHLPSGHAACNLPHDDFQVRVQLSRIQSHFHLTNGHKIGPAILREGIESAVASIGLGIHGQEFRVRANELFAAPGYQPVAVVGNNHQVILRQQFLQPSAEFPLRVVRQNIIAHHVNLE